MTNEELIFAQYRLYSEAKENYVDRSFTTNKFYMVLVIILLLLTFLTKDFTIGKITSPAIFCFIGMLTCSLWWLNVDTYNLLIKIKFSKVLEEIEKQLPTQPYAMEYKALKDYRSNQKGFVFSDVQKIFSVICFISFITLFLVDLIPRLISVEI